MKTNLLIAAVLTTMALAVSAAPLTESTYTEVIREVNTLSTAGDAATAKLNDLLKAPDRVRTGPESRAELTAPDNTITRVGANTVFSYADSGRTLNLEKGSLLFHSPKGKGGGVIKSGGASAAVLGTTLLVSATPEGGFKVILLEGKGKVTLANGKSVTLKGGQLVFVLANGGTFSTVFDINLGKLVAGSSLINGFSHPLPSLPLIQTVIKKQNSALAAGTARDSGDSANGLAGVDPGTYQTAAHAPASGAALEAANPQTAGFVLGQNGIGGRPFVSR